MKRLTNYDVYTAEGVLSPDGKKIVFTSSRTAISTSTR
jgi:TolB protein